MCPYLDTSSSSRQASLSLILKACMEDFNASQGTGENGSNNKLSFISRQLDDMAGCMKQNISRVMERGEHIESILSKAGILNEEVRTFRTSSRRLKRALWFKNVKLCLLTSCIILVALVFAARAAFGWSWFPWRLSSSEAEN